MSRTRYLGLAAALVAGGLAVGANTADAGVTTLVSKAVAHDGTEFTVTNHLTKPAQATLAAKAAES